MCISTAQARALSWSWSLLWRPCKSFMVHSWRSLVYEDFGRSLVAVLVRRCCEDPDEILSAKRSLHDLAHILIRRSCEDHRLRGGPSMSFHKSKKVLWRSWWSPFLEVLANLRDAVQVLVRRSCGDPGRILVERSLHEESCRCHVLEVLCLYDSSSGMLLGGSCLKIL